MTREQLSAREAIATLEGELTSREDGRYLVCTTFDGRVYRIDPDARRIWRTDFNEHGYVCATRMFDLCELEEMVANPMLFGGPSAPPEDIPRDDELYEDVYARERTDYEEERAIEMAEDRQRIQWDEDYYGRMEAA